MSRAKELEKLRLVLQRRRRAVLETSRGAREELRALKDQERDPEYEEGAQSELADYTLSQLVESHRRELELIDSAFQRMDQGVYGECVDCGADIPLDRLRALPFAIRCEEDARMYERERRGSPQQANFTL
ncbi:MAG: TraR/DksA C4-type zinc finger protein [Myxococcaceae bacterium]|nr:TraR/DksA C4-type zinc finger protein [Myxococcaceae bacterium]MCI0672173.1 TraR/DksA C4-type zinc finger protein [Myxococcaceae bacterium]